MSASWILAAALLPAAFGDLDATPGSWVEYLVRDRGGGALRVRVSVLPAAAPEGRHWLELDTVAAGLPPQAVRLLFRGSSIGPRDVERMELYVVGQAPLAIPVDQTAGQPAKQRRPRRLRDQPVRTRAGTFAAHVFQAGDTRLWRSEQVPLWGLVRSRSPRETVELLGSGRQGAHSVFPEDPR